MIRSIFFNLIYYGTTLLLGVLLLPTLVLPTRVFWPVMRLYFWYVYGAEKYVLGLDYRVIGRENLPADGRYIVAAKHQSAYETLKLPLLFPHPVVILKRELLMIPLWGWYAAKAGMIGINRGRPREALTKLRAGVRQAIDQGRTVVIFPQGTRTAPTDTPTEKPYKHGVFDAYNDNHVPTVPMAVNAGLFWPRKAFLKRGGTVTISFLPAIPPGLDKESFMSTLQNQIENETARLVQETQNIIASHKKHRTIWRPLNLLMIAGTIFALYTAAWFYVATSFQKEANMLWKQAPQNGLIISLPPARIHGFPGPYTLTWSGNMRAPDLEITAPRFVAQFWPLPYAPLTIEFPEGLLVEGKGLNMPEHTQMKFKYLMMKFQIPSVVPNSWIKSEIQKLHDSGVTYRLLDFRAEGPYLSDQPLIFSGHGELSYDENLQPAGRMDLVFGNPDQVESALTNAVKGPLGQSIVHGLMGQFKTVDPKTKLTVLPLTFTLKDSKMYVGPLRLGSMRRIYWPLAETMPASPPPLAPAP